MRVCARWIHVMCMHITIARYIIFFPYSVSLNNSSICSGFFYELYSERVVCAFSLFFLSSIIFVVFNAFSVNFHLAELIYSKLLFTGCYSPSRQYF